MNGKLTRAEKRIISAKIRSQKEQPFFYHLILNLNIKPMPKECEMQTMGVDNLGNMYYADKFVLDLTTEQLFGVLSHEILHLAFSHPQRRKNRQHDIWNVACFPKGNLIKTIEGYKDISKIEKGDFVLDKDGKYVKVVALHEKDYKEHLIEINCIGNKNITCTQEHPFLACKKKRGSPVRLGKPEWVEAKNLTNDYYLLFPKDKTGINRKEFDLRKFINKTKTNNHTQSNNVKYDNFKLNKDTAWLLGLYVADGSKNNKDYNGINISLNALKDIQVKDKLKRILKKHINKNVREEVRDNTTKISICGTMLSKFLEKECGHLARNKKVPEFILNTNKKGIVKSFLKGYIAGDGCKIKNGFSCGTISKELALGIQFLCNKIGWEGKITYSERKERVIRGKKLPIEKIYTIIVTEKRLSNFKMLNGKKIKSNNNRWKNLDNFIATPIKTLYPKYFEKTKVYNFETESHTYVVNNLCVHNCDISVNCMIKASNLELPQGCLVPDYNDEMLVNGNIKIEKCSEKSPEIIYEELEKKLPKKDAKNLMFDKHEWDKAGDKGKKGKGQTSGNKDFKKALVEAKTFAEMRGKLNAGIKKILEDYIDGTINWKNLLRRKLLKEIITDYTYSRCSKRSLACGFYLPDVVKENVKICVAVDVSGSISDDDYKAFLGEIIEMKRSHRHIEINFLQWDTEVMKDTIITGNEDVKDIKLMERNGYGGTEASCIKKYLDKQGKKVNSLYILSDGFIEDIEEKDLPQCSRTWLITKQGSADIPNGLKEEVIQIK